ncbi:putative MFS family arabinose efflux permease [Brevundimonas vesicularis]|uniref:Putative MFS family arabinose efflux permease n=1 Tax=Brevundimonas vesicularis TaxID=41276 RepID=A0A7W9L4E7_BREVE|nr:MFS transporter [Brevundimonas vesicularis]MBB5770248.1 putative MFS family arabinose efflux permease [Brevundimonas vesicularis]
MKSVNDVAVSDAPSSGASVVPALFLALGTFAIGTEGFMIAPLLPTMAADFGLTVPTVAMLVVVFTFTLAVSSPISTVATGRVDRRNVLLLAMAVFTAGNLLAAMSTGFWSLMVARILMALAAGLYAPTANALAGAVAGPAFRGRALAIVSGGMTIAIALGLPLGALVGHAFGWRATFLAVAVMGVVAMLGVSLGVRRSLTTGLPVADLAARLAVFRAPAVMRLLGVTLFWAIGAYAAYPYIASYLADVLEFGVGETAAAVSIWGLFAALGVTAGGALSDRVGSTRVVVGSLAALTLAFWGLALAAGLPARAALAPALIAIAVWGFSVWSFFPAQMARLIAAVRPDQGSVSLSLNTSTMYLGFSIGSAFGAGILGAGAVWGIGLFAGVASAMALVMDRALVYRADGR